jgi:hypothetical protein
MTVMILIISRRGYSNSHESFIIKNDVFSQGGKISFRMRIFPFDRNSVEIEFNRSTFKHPTIKLF